MTEHKPKAFDFNNITVSFRFVLPIMLGGYFIAYNHDRDIQQQQFSEVKISIVDMKAENTNAHQKLWEALTTYQSKENKDFNCLAQNVARCCKDSITCV